MKWFGYVWIAITILIWLVWTIKCVKDFISDFRSRGGLKNAVGREPSWLVWVLVNTSCIFLFSLFWFLFNS